MSDGDYQYFYFLYTDFDISDQFFFAQINFMFCQNSITKIVIKEYFVQCFFLNFE